MYQSLSAKYTPEKPLKNYKIIATEEEGVCYKANLVPPRPAAVFQVDGRIITAGSKCDKLVLSQNPSDTSTWLGHFIELKGTDVQHAIDQLEATLRHPVFRHKTLVRKYARIVARSFPSSKGHPAVERARERFKRYGCELKTLKSNNPETI